MLNVPEIVERAAAIRKAGHIPAKPTRSFSVSNAMKPTKPVNENESADWYHW